jgi:hypothetical protein
VDKKKKVKDLVDGFNKYHFPSDWDKTLDSIHLELIRFKSDILNELTDYIEENKELPLEKIHKNASLQDRIIGLRDEYPDYRHKVDEYYDYLKKLHLLIDRVKTVMKG